MRQPSPNRRCQKLSFLLNDYKKNAGSKFSNRKLAKVCGMAPITVKKWFYGHPPLHLVWWNIARYFEPLIDVPAETIKQDIENTILEWRK
jgi:hypothetical protein